MTYLDLLTYCYLLEVGCLQMTVVTTTTTINNINWKLGTLVESFA